MGLGGQGHAPAALPPGKGLRTPYLEGWVGSRVGLNMLWKSRPQRYWIPGPYGIKYSVNNRLTTEHILWQEEDVN